MATFLQDALGAGEQTTLLCPKGLPGSEAALQAELCSPLAPLSLCTHE